ncbi:hypothetical protein SAMN05421809_1311 [Natronorubrum daqingense]|uniref:Uncharacterized protein n=1 Tax=Natronorubrum daqingense TaxID=588898 RepID=A0A1N7BQI3_9EURY|nr:hypothetical protein SAMN05421809_1311 [Natronorubrum daqingense]
MQWELNAYWATIDIPKQIVLNYTTLPSFK